MMENFCEKKDEAPLIDFAADSTLVTMPSLRMSAL